MTAYWMARANPRDLTLLQQYADILSEVGGRYPFKPLARQERFVELEGNRHFEQYYLHEFPSLEAALAMYNSPEYQRATATRQAACDGCEIVILDGGDSFRGTF